MDGKKEDKIYAPVRCQHSMKGIKTSERVSRRRVGQYKGLELEKRRGMVECHRQGDKKVSEGECLPRKERQASKGLRARSSPKDLAVSWSAGKRHYPKVKDDNLIGKVTEVGMLPR